MCGILSLPVRHFLFHEAVQRNDIILPQVRQTERKGVMGWNIFSLNIFSMWYSSKKTCCLPRQLVALKSSLLKESMAIRNPAQWMVHNEFSMPCTCDCLQPAHEGALTSLISGYSTPVHSTKLWSGTESHFYTSWTFLPPIILLYTKGCMAHWTTRSLKLSAELCGVSHKITPKQTSVDHVDSSWSWPGLRCHCWSPDLCAFLKQSMDKGRTLLGNARHVMFTCVFKWKGTVS